MASGIGGGRIGDESYGGGLPSGPAGLGVTYTLPAAVSFEDEIEADVSVVTNTVSARVAFTDYSFGSASSAYSDSDSFRVVMVTKDGTPVASLENAKVESVTFPLNSWETWSFSLPVDDPKAHFILEEKMSEAQVWWGDQLLSWGPMTRPQVVNGLMTVACNGANWHLSRRNVGKANRDNLMRNPSFEDGLANWNFLKTAWWLDYQPLNPGDAFIRSPGLGGGTSKALQLTIDLEKKLPFGYGTEGFVMGGVPGSNPWGLVYPIGATLFDVSEIVYGTPEGWFFIWTANKEMLIGLSLGNLGWKIDITDPETWMPPDWRPPLWIPPLPESAAVGVVADDDGWGEVIAYQHFTVNGGKRGATLTLTGHIYIPSSRFTDWGLGRSGVFLGRLPTDWATNNYLTRNNVPNTWGGRRAFYTDMYEYSGSRVDEGHPFDEWVRHECSITVPPGETEVVHARLSGVQGLTYWDRTTLTEDTAVEFFEKDQTEIIEGLVTHAQDPAFGKNDINIQTERYNSGVRRTLVALHSEHANIWNLAQEQTEPDDGIDISARYTPTNRYLVTHFPRKGDYRPEFTLRFGRNISSYDWTFDGETAATSTIILGTGDGSDREEAAKVNTSEFADGLILEAVEAAPPDTEVGKLQSLANEASEVNRRPEILQLTTVPHDLDHRETRFIGRLAVGDVLPVQIRDGAVYDSDGVLTGYALNVNEKYRVVSMTINENGTLSLTMNRRDFEFIDSIGG